MAKQNKCNDAIKMGDVQSQTHLQGSQSRHTKANLAKELALFQPHKDFTKKHERTESQIDQLVYKLYDLTKEEINFIENA